jgi:hypothetical protein
VGPAVSDAALWGSRAVEPGRRRTAVIDMVPYTRGAYQGGRGLLPHAVVANETMNDNGAVDTQAAQCTRRGGEGGHRVSGAGCWTLRQEVSVQVA